MKLIACSFVFAVLLELASRSDAHPGAIAEGRGSCGAEFDSAQTAFQIPDITEGWYVRRVGTCTHPFFWVTFNTSVKEQKVTFVAGSPEFAGFEDKLNFNAVLFGPGYAPLDTPAALVDWQVEVPSGLGGKVLSSPSSFGSCDFVSNPVMTQYKSVTNGRCMEHMTIEAGYKTVGLAGKTWHNWWLANHDLRIPVPGTHYLVIWASHRTTNKVAAGKIEVTMGPWTWSSLAGKSITKQAQSQTTTCSCAINHASWYGGQNLEMIGYVSPSLFSSQLPFQECSKRGVTSSSSCRASLKSTAIPSKEPNGSSVEWSGLFELKAGTYNWDFFAFRYHTEWKFPDSTMDVVIVPTQAASGLTALEGAESSADKAMHASLAVEAPASKTHHIGWYIPGVHSHGNVTESHGTNIGPGKKMTVRVNDTVHFMWKDKMHQLDKMLDEAHLTSCNFTGSTVVQAAAVTASYTLGTAATGTHYFSCNVSGHCAAGQKIIVTIAPQTASVSGQSSPSLLRPSEQMPVGSLAPTVFRVSLPKPTGSASSNVTFKLVVPANGFYAFFTQHRPAEFLAEQLTCTTACPAGEKYAFWQVSKSYGVSTSAPTVVTTSNGNKTTVTTVAATSSAPPSVASLVSFVLLWLAIRL